VLLKGLDDAEGHDKNWQKEIGVGGGGNNRVKCFSSIFVTDSFHLL